jgi:nicotinamide mononucleotide transporter
MNDTVQFFGFTTTLLELLSFILSVVTVALNIRQIHWAWLFSILSSGLYASVFFDARLYGDMGLQWVFIIVSVWGWFLWWRGIDGSSQLPVSALGFREGACRHCMGSGICGVGMVLKSYTDTDVPLADGFLTAGSLLGQVLLSRKN